MSALTGNFYTLHWRLKFHRRDPSGDDHSSHQKCFLPTIYILFNFTSMYHQFFTYFLALVYASTAYCSMERALSLLSCGNHTAYPILRVSSVTGGAERGWHSGGSQLLLCHIFLQAATANFCAFLPLMGHLLLFFKTPSNSLLSVQLFYSFLSLCNHFFFSASEITVPLVVLVYLYNSTIHLPSVSSEYAFHAE